MSVTSSFNRNSAAAKPKCLTHYDAETPVRNVRFAPDSETTQTLSYAYLISVEFSSKSNTITLTFTTHVVVLKGHNLAPLRDALEVHNVKAITTIEERYVATAEETESLVTHIAIEAL